MFEFTSPDPSKIHFPIQKDSPSNAFILLLVSALILSLFGLTMLYSTSYDRGSALFIKQLTWTVLGISSCTTVYFIGYKRIIPFLPYILAICAVLLIIPRFFPPVKGAYRWIRFGPVSIQPSEFAKIFTIIFLASYCAVKQPFINKWKIIFKAFAVLGFMAALVLIGKDLGMTILICSIGWMIFFLAGMRLIIILGLPALIAPPGILYLYFFDPVRWSRITSFTNPEASHLESGYQLFNSLMALGSGHWTGLGFTASKMKAYYLPEAHTDFILSIVGEELGYLSILIVITFYAIIFFSSLSIAKNARDKQGFFIAFSLGAMLALQAIINLGVISGLFPTKGMPAPFLSYGGSNILMAWTAIGFILSIETSDANETNNRFMNVKMRAENENFE